MTFMKNLFCRALLLMVVFLFPAGCTSKAKEQADLPSRQAASEKTPNPWFHDGCLELTPESEQWILSLEKDSNPLFQAELIAYRTSYKSLQSAGMAHGAICGKIGMSETLKKAFQ